MFLLFGLLRRLLRRGRRQDSDSEVRRTIYVTQPVPYDFGARYPEPPPDYYQNQQIAYVVEEPKR